MTVTNISFPSAVMPILHFCYNKFNALGKDNVDTTKLRSVYYK